MCRSLGKRKARSVKLHLELRALTSQGEVFRDRLEEKEVDDEQRRNDAHTLISGLAKLPLC